MLKYHIKRYSGENNPSSKAFGHLERRNTNVTW